MAIAYRAAGTKTNRASSNTSDLSVPPPAGHQAGDLFLLTATIAKYPGGPTGTTINTPSGYTLIATSSNWGLSTDIITAYYWHIAASASEPNLTVGTTGPASWLDTMIAAFSGVDGTTPIDVASSFGANDKGGTRTQPGITTLTNNALLLYLMAEGDGQTATVPAGSTSRYATGIVVADYKLATLAAPTAGAIAATSWAVVGGPYNYGSVCITIALRESGATVGSTFVPRIVIIT
jgi:hypothetical protein